MLAALMRSQQFSFIHLRLLLALLSLMFSAFIMFNDDIINSDGILYIQMAEAFNNGGISAMADIYDWPFFAILIALFSQLTGIALEASAAIINILLYVIFTDALLLISRQLLPNTRQLIIAAGLILLFYSINDYRDFIIRDVGYWAFLSLGLNQFLIFLKKHRWQEALLWQAFGLIALLFRIEALIILLLMPLIIVFFEKTASIKSLAKLYSLLAIVSLGVSFFVIAGSGWTEAFGKLDNIHYYLNLTNFHDRFADHAQLIADNILHPVADDDGGKVLFFGLLGMLLVELLMGLSAAYIIILLLTWRVRLPLFESNESKAISYFLLMNFAFLLAFSLHRYFITSRYCVMAVIALFFLVLPRLTAFIDDVINHRKYSLQVLIVLLLIYSVGDVVYSSNSKAFIPETAKWAGQNIPANSKVLTLDEFSAYYFDKYAQENQKITERNRLKSYKNYDYLLIVEKRRDNNLKETLAELPVKALYSQENKRGDKATVYQVLNTTL